MKSVQSVSCWLACGIVAMLMLLVVAPADAQEKLKDKDPQIDAAIAEINAAQKDLMPQLAGKDVYGDEKTRAELSPKVLPPLHRMLGAIQTIQAHDPDADKSYNVELLALLAYFGDADIAIRLTKDSQSSNEAESCGAHAALLLKDWWTSAHDASGQKKVLEQLEALAKGHAESDAITRAIMMMRDASASDELRDASLKILTDDLKGPLARNIAPQLQAEAKMREMVGRPLVISGVVLDGSKFTSADWKGKVVMVDFWATWCGPCKEELPNVKKAYADYHSKGLEIIGVSCDNGAGPLKDFLGKNPDMPWPQLFDPAKPGWHEIATNLGVQGIPTMFLIDRAGILRTTEARGNLDKEISKLLEEKPLAK